jgi:pyrimidine oxygenase
VLSGAMTGSVQTLARRLARIVLEGQLDGMTLIVPDFIDDLRIVGEQVLPLMEQMGVSTKVSRRAAVPA